MSSFDFIPNRKEYDEIRNICQKIDKLTKPEEIASTARKLLEVLLRYIYYKEMKKYPVNASMLEIIDSPTITNYVNCKELIDSIHYVRKVGMNALHNIKVKKKQAQIAKDNIIFFVRYVIKKEEQPDTLSDIVLPQYMSEAETRKIYIDLYLEEAGWDVIEPTGKTVIAGGIEVASGTVFPGKACSEIPVKGLENASGIGFCDYVLYGNDGKPLAIVEAKKTSEEITKGVKQVKEYGACMKEQYGYVPVLYYTNGYETHVIDGLYPDRLVIGFHSLEELDYMIQRRKRKDINTAVVDRSIAGRPYQLQAITKVCERFNDKYRRTLLVMATGTGKTRTSISLVKTLLDNEWIKNVLFLADRTSLVEQAFKNFKKILPDMSYQVLSNKKLANEPNARVIFSTHQTMINYIDAEDKEYTCGRFDLIIVDEAHRSIFNKYGSIFSYFDALLVGLTATPREEVDADTYKLFGCESGEPHFEYKLDEAVKDKFLVHYKVEGRTTKLLSSGIKYGSLSEDDKKKVDSVLVDEEEPEDDYLIPKSKIFKLIYNRNTCAKVLEDLMTNGMKVEDGQLIGKSIIFAYNHKHAEMIVNTFREIFPNYGDDYCQLVDNKVKNANQLITDFEEQPNFRIAVSVDMLDTGIDVPEVLNLVFFKPVKSHIKFVQMIGRGTRLCPELIDGEDKKFFLIFDYFDNFAFFDEHPDGFENCNGKSLTQRLFDIKLDILVELQSFERQSDKICKVYYDKLKTELYSKAKKIKDSSTRIAVREEMPFVDKYLDYDRWNVIAPLSKKEIQLHLSKLIDNDVDENKGALRFDMHMLQIELSILATGGIGSVSKQVERVRKIAKYLLDYAAGRPAVFEKADILKDLVSVEFWTKPTMDKMELYREEVRNLLIYLPPGVQPVNIDTPDEVETVDYKGSLIDIRTYKEKVIDYLLKHSDNKTIKKIQNLEKIDATDLKELERILWCELGTIEDYQRSTDIENLAAFIRSIVGVDQNAINEKFGDFLGDNVLNSVQQEFVRSIIDYVRENGDIQAEDLIEKAPFDSYNIIDLFGTNVAIVTKIIGVMHDSILVA
ncbi:MAG: DEAD/DEAH box helicase family protein [Lachnospiraceae bacterium]